jgi:hypothetical protein
MALAALVVRQSVWAVVRRRATSPLCFLSSDSRCGRSFDDEYLFVVLLGVDQPVWAVVR